MNKTRKSYLNDLSLIKASKQKHDIIMVLGDGNIKIPSEIGNLLGLKSNHASANLKDLKERRIMECLNEYKIKGGLYCIIN